MRRDLLSIAMGALLVVTGGSALAQGTENPPPASAPITPADPLREAAIQLSRGNVQRALELYTQALNDSGLTSDRRAVILTDRGIAHWRLRQTKAAIEDFNRAVTLYPEYAAAYNNRGNVLLALDLPKEAIKDFDRAILLAPGYAAAYNNRANAAVKLGELRRAGEDFTKAIELAPTSAAPINGRGRVHLAMGRPFAAVRDFTRAASLDAKFAAGFRNRAEAYLSLDKPTEAIEDLTRALTFEPDNVELLILRGNAQVAVRAFEPALKDFDRAIEVQPASAAAYRSRGLAFAKAGAHDDALNDLAKAIELDQRSGVAYALRAWTYKQMQSVDLAWKDIERAARLEPEMPEVLWVRGEIAEASGQTEAAVADLKRAVQLDPRLKEAWAALGRLGQEIRSEVVELANAGFEDWRVIVDKGRHFAISDSYPRLRVPLEMMGEGQPRLLDWEEKNPPFKGIGLLRFYAGLQPGKTSKVEEVEHIAIVDIGTSTVVAVEPHRLGQTVAQWTWGDGRLVVANADGLTSEHVLRAAAKPREPQRRIAEQRPEGWSPWEGGWWGGNSGNRPQQRGGQGQRQQPKTLFQLLFGN